MMNQHPAISGIYGDYENTQDANQLIAALKNLAIGTENQSSEDDTTQECTNVEQVRL